MESFNDAVIQYKAVADPSVLTLLTTPTAYKAGSLYNIIPTGTEMSVTRAGTTGTRVNKAGIIENVAANIPRITWSGGVPLLAVAPAMTNLFRNSEPASDPGQGSRSNVTFAANDWGIGLTGKLVLASNAVLRIYTNTASLAAGDYTIAAIVSKTGGTKPVHGTDFTFVYQYTDSGITVTQEVDLGGGRWLIVSQRTTSVSSTENGIAKLTSHSATQVEASAFMMFAGFVTLNISDYIRTTGSTETRNADVIVYDLGADSTVSLYPATGAATVAAVSAGTYTIPAGFWKRIEAVNT